MRELHSEPNSKPKANGHTIFPIVPITDVLALGPTDAVAKDRPVVLVVKKEPDIVLKVVEILNQNGFVAIPAFDAEEALETALLIPPELVIADIELPGMSGVEVAAALKKELPDCKVLLLADLADKGKMQRSVAKAGNEISLANKPAHPADMLAHVAATLKP